MDRFWSHEELIKTAVICVAIVITTGLIVYGVIKFNQLRICSSIQNEQIRTTCVKTAR